MRRKITKLIIIAGISLAFVNTMPNSMKDVEANYNYEENVDEQDNEEDDRIQGKKPDIPTVRFDENPSTGGPGRTPIITDGCF